MPRKIANKALIQTLQESITVARGLIQNARWLLLDVAKVARFDESVKKEQLDHIERASRNIRDCEHAIAALEQEIDNE